MQLAEIINQFHFIRPAWLWALVVLVILLWLYARAVHTSRSWQAVCDPQLLPYILAVIPGRTKRWPLFIIAFTGLLIIIALAGPVWQQLEQPVFREQSALVIVLDLSRSMDAADIKPSRVARARLKIIDILKQRNEGQTALVVYAADAFVVSPLTDDAETIIAQVPSLSTSLMPNQGSRPDLALAKAAQLLQQAGVPRGEILLVSDGAEGDMLTNTITDLTQKGHRLSVLGVGTTQGVPVALEGGGFLKDRDGAIVVPKLDEQALHSVALQGGGRYRTLATDDSDMQSFLADFEASRLDTVENETGFKADIWREEGPWLLLLVIPLAALVFRRGYLVVFLLLWLPVPQPAYAMSWEDLWSRPDQQASRALEQGDASKAAGLFTDPQWKAAAHYRAKDYQQSVDALGEINTPEAWYNKGNALARLGRLPDAIAAYDKALELDSRHEDARYNRDLLKKQMEQQPQEQSQQQSDQQQSQASDSKSGQDGQKSQSGQDKSQQDNSQQNQSAQNQQGSKSGSTSSADEKDSSQQQQQQGQLAGNEKKEDGSANSLQPDNKNKQTDASKQDAMNAARQEKDPQKDGDKTARAQAMADMIERSEIEQANEQWLRRIPDDPGGLLRRKFQYQSQQNRRQQSQEAQPW